MVTGCLRTTKVTIFAVYTKKAFCENEKYGTLCLSMLTGEHPCFVEAHNAI